MVGKRNERFDSAQRPNHRENVESEESELKRKAVKYKAFQHTFSKKDFQNGMSEKIVLQKLKTSKHLESSYNNYLSHIEKDPTKKAMFPWDSPSRQLLYWLMNKVPFFTKWFTIIILALLTFNYIPGPTQHIAEFIIARAIYDTAGIPRIPEALETYAHSAKIIDSQGAIIKTYGKRRVTQKIPDQVKKALLACEDHYLLPNPHNPWYVNAFLIHGGVSWINLLGAVKDTLMGHTRGASTIVMQNAKKILANDKRTIAHKLEEIVDSYMLVAKFGKDKNLDFYINTVPVGANMYGFSAASRNYFKKNLKDLNFQQLVTIGSFIPNHNRQLAFYEIWRGKNFNDLSKSYRRHAHQAIAKVNMALGYLRDTGEINQDQYKKWRLSDEESIRRIGFRKYSSPLYGEEEWTSWNVIHEVTSRYYNVRNRKISGERLLLDEKGDVVIETDVNLALIEKIKEIITTFLHNEKFKKILVRRNKKIWLKDQQLYEKRRIAPPYNNFDEFMSYLYKHINIGVLLINQQGRFIAYVGGKQFLYGTGGDVPEPEQDEPQLNRKAIIIDLMNRKARITPASTIKPIISYNTMLVNNKTLQSTFADKPIEYKYLEREGHKVWIPRNWYPYDAKGHGNNRYFGRRYNLLEAQVISINTIFARLYSKSSIRSAVLAGFDQIGMQYNHEDAKYWPFGIGASAVPVQKWLGIYNAFLDGNYRDPTFVKRITINNKVIYNAIDDPRQKPIPLFDAKREREDEMQALIAVCNRGSGASMRKNFKNHYNLVSGKTGTAPNGRASLFVSNFNPYQNRLKHQDKNMSMIVIVTTNTGGYKSVGTSTQGPTQIAGSIYNYLFQQDLQQMIDTKIEQAKKDNPAFRKNYLNWAKVNDYMDKLLNGKCGKKSIYPYLNGIDGYGEALNQILNQDNKIYSGRDDLFKQLVHYYCNQNKLVH
jgi:membrane peptidoglycan carboxypeptidase